MGFGRVGKQGFLVIRAVDWSTSEQGDMFCGGRREAWSCEFREHGNAEKSRKA